MTREEELHQAADNFSEAHKYDEDNDYVITKIAPIEAVKCVATKLDLSSLWHDASEMPEDDIEPLIYSVDNGNFVGIKNAHNLMIEIMGKKMRTWEKTVECEGIDKWAYLRDFMPKGGEE